MTRKVEKIRLNLITKLESLYHFWKEWLQKHPGIIRIYTIFSWVSLIAFILSLIFMEDSRKMFVQFFWSFYVILQFWLLCRSKTLSWKKYSYFFLAGAWLIIPLNAMIVQFITAIFGGAESDLWSQAFLTPIAEEVLKLIPLGVYLFLSRRASSLGLCDYALIGAATGAGFQFLEETSRRLVTGGFFDYGTTLFGGQVLHWDLFTLFPGYFEESFLPDHMTAGHPLLTAMVALGIGLAIRFKDRFKRHTYIFPAFLLVWAIFDHAIWNANYNTPEWLIVVHDFFGSGYASKPVFLIMLGAALFIDYREINRVREQIPLLEGEKNINPVMELWNLGNSLIKDRRRFGYFLYFYRERRELGFTLLHGDKDAKERLPILMTNIQRYYYALTLIIAVLLFAHVGWESSYSSQDACFACLFDSLQNWWDGLSVLEKGIILGGAFALSVPFLGVWSAIGAISAGLTVAASGHQVAEMIRDPRKLLTPEYAAASILTLGMSRLPFGKIVAKKVLKTAKGLERYELTTAGGLTYRTTLGSKGEIRSVFAKIEPRHINTGTETNKASRDFARLLGKKTDDAGHGIGKKLGGLGTKSSGNIFPQNSSINRGRFRAFEKMIADEVLAGKDVFVRVVPKYAAGSTRPSEVLYSVRIDGKTISRIFPNP